MNMSSRSWFEDWIITFSEDTRMWIDVILGILTFGLSRNTRLEGRLMGRTGKEVDWYDYIEANMDKIEKNHFGISGLEGIHESWINDEMLVSFWHDGTEWRGGLYRQNENGGLDMKVILFYPPASKYLKTRCKDLSERILHRCVSKNKEVWKKSLHSFNKR